MSAKLARVAPLLAAGLALAGCANLASVPPGTPAQQVQARFGAPKEIWKNTDGSQTWEYPFGPSGYQTYMVALGTNQSVLDVHQVLSDPYFDRVKPGMSRQDVQRIIGRPKEIVYFPARDEETWSWRYMDGRPMFFNVLFDRASGTVLTTQRLEEVFQVPDR